MAIGLPEATLLATIFSSTLFGLFTAVYGYTIYILRHKHERNGRFPFVIASVSTGMYIFSLAFFVASVIRTTAGFLSPHPTAYFFDSAAALYVLRVTLLVAQTVLGDGFLIYRLHRMYGRLFLITLPACLLWTGELVSGTGALHAVAMASSETSIFEMKNWIASFLYLTLATNGFCTICIALRLYFVHRDSAQYRVVSSISLLSVVEIIVESAAIYSAALVSLVGTLLSNSWAQYIVLDLLPHIIGIVFSIIIIRAHMSLNGISCPASLSLSISQGTASGIPHRLHPRSKTPTISISAPGRQSLSLGVDLGTPGFLFPTKHDHDPDVGADADGDASPTQSAQPYSTKVGQYGDVDGGVDGDVRLTMPMPTGHGETDRDARNGAMGPLKVRVERATVRQVV